MENLMVIELAISGGILQTVNSCPGTARDTAPAEVPETGTARSSARDRES